MYRHGTFFGGNKRKWLTVPVAKFEHSMHKYIFVSPSWVIILFSHSAAHL